MFSGNSDRVPMSVWFPILPPEDVMSLRRFEHSLHKINGAYDDWRAIMGKKSLIGTKVGVILDRIRMLMINIGIASGQNREMAERVQILLSKRLREAALGLVEGNSGVDKAVRVALANFFGQLEFTRDIDPREEILHNVPNSKSNKELYDVIFLECTKIVKRLYIRLLSPNPWDY